MKIKSLVITTILLTSTIWSQAQQINPVPDYVFRNQMSVGRNAVTDTAAYFSIGPRYGATKGFMPPIVGDTATFSSGKRNGLLIFSVQKNKFLYWDSVRVQWSDMAGSSGAYIVAGDTSAMLAPYLRKVDTTAMLSPYYRSATASAALALKLNISDTSSMLANYIRHAGYGLTKSGQSFLVDTLNIATRAWRQKGLDSLAALEVSGSGTTNYVAKFTGSGSIGNSIIFDEGTNVGIGTTSPGSKLDVRSTGYNIIRSTGGNGGYFDAYNTSGTRLASFGAESAGDVYFGSRGSSPVIAITNSTERLRIFANGRVFIGASATDAGYQLDINGTLRSVNGANFATSSGQVTVNTTTAQSGYNLTVGAGSNTTNGLISLNGGADANYGSGIAFRRGGTSKGFIGTQSWVVSGTSDDISLYASAGSGLQFYTNGAYKASINTDGELLINTTSDAGDYKLQVSGNIYNTGSAVLAATSGNVGIGTASPTVKLDVSQASTGSVVRFQGDASLLRYLEFKSVDVGAFTGAGWDRNVNSASGFHSWSTVGVERGRINSAGEWIIDASGTDAGDYKLQVVGNARIGTGKLDIASNTTFGIGVARSGTSEVAGQIYNSNGILYLGAESSAGGQIFSGSSAYAGVIGTGANYPLQFAVNNITRGGFSTSGNLLLGFTTDSYFLKLQVNGSIFTNNQFFGQGANAQLSIDSSTNISPLYVSAHSLTGSSAQGLFYGSTTWNTTGNPSLIDLAITNTASGSDANYIKISDGSNIFRVTKAAEVVTAAPTGGSIRKWKLGEAATVSPTSPNRTIRVEIDGTVYYLHAKTTND